MAVGTQAVYGQAESGSTGPEFRFGLRIHAVSVFSMIPRLLAWIVSLSQRNAILMAAAAAMLAALSLFTAAHKLGINTDTNLMFPESLPWRANQLAFNKDFPQVTNLLVAVIDARIPEEADLTAAALAAGLAGDADHFAAIRRPDASPFFDREGLMLIDSKQLGATLDTIIAAQPFLGEMTADPTARGLFASLSLVGQGAARGDSGIDSFLPALDGFHHTLADVLDGHPEPLSWQKLLGGGLSDLGGKYKFVLFNIKPQFGALVPGAGATAAIRQAAANLEFVKSGDARVRITGPVALSDDEFASVAQGAVAGLIGSVVLITLWLYLAVRTWRLIVPILLTLGAGLTLTLLFAAVAVGTLNLVSVGFGILFVGIAVDFAIQFCVRYRDLRLHFPDPAAVLTATGRRVGRQILVAAAATSAGFLAFVPTDFRGVAELGLIAGVGMIIAFVCTIIFLPAFITLFHPRGEKEDVGFHWGARLDQIMVRRRGLVLSAFGALAVLALVLAPRLTFDSDPLHTKDQSTEAVRTLYDLMNSPVTNPFTIDIITPDSASAAAEAKKLARLPLVSAALSINSFVPTDQDAKLAAIADAKSLLEPTLDAQPAATPLTADSIRQAAQGALRSIAPALAKLSANHPLARIAEDLRRLTTAPDAVLLEANRSLTRFLPMQLDRLRTLLDAQPVTIADVPAEIARDWVLPDGRARVQLVPTPEASGSSAGLRRFVDQILPLAPGAGGAAVIIEATSDTIIGAFRGAAITALIAIAIILFVTLRRFLDMALVLAPLLLSSLLTVLIAVLAPIPLNFANIIALPLLLGVGVSFNIYFVMNWRAGQNSVLGSATARAILFSALTTGTAFGSLALSAHPGTASMGLLLLISLGCTLISSLAFIPALLAAAPRRLNLPAMPAAVESSE
jgi:hopanoid biosynthesis associated RND transporter like protein HpnN